MKKWIAAALIFAMLPAAGCSKEAAQTQPITEQTTAEQTQSVPEEPQIFDPAQYDHAGTCGINVQWGLKLDTGELVIAGEGDMDSNYAAMAEEGYDMDLSAPEFSAYAAQIRSVSIWSGVTGIGESVFAEYPALTKVEAADSVLHVGASAFKSCPALTEVTLGNGVLMIGEYAFQSCSALKTVSLGESVQTICTSAFAECTALTDLVLPASLTAIDHWAFNRCESLTSIAIPEGVTKLYLSTFNGCTALAEVSLPAGLTEIEANAFVFCDALSKVSYGGTQTQWDAITIAEGNESLQSAQISFS